MLLFAALLAQAFIRTGAGAWAVGLAYISYDTLLLFFVAFKTDHIGRAHSEQDDALPLPSLAAIVAAHNEASVLETTIEALRRQDAAPDLIIIADDGSAGDESMDSSEENDVIDDR